MTASFGERLSALIVAAYLNRDHPAAFVDARDFAGHRRPVHARGGELRQDEPRRPARASRAPGSPHARAAIPVVTGFIGATDDGQTTTIGRNGSDYSAAIVGAAVGASVIEIWTDVDGVLSADPEAVPSAFVLPQMTYEEAMELSYFGAKVLHSATIAPAVAKRIPILIKNTFNPTAPGTLHLERTRPTMPDWWPRASRSVDDLALLTLRGPGMVGVPGIAERLFRTLAGRTGQRHPDLAGLVRAHDLLRRARAPTRRAVEAIESGVPVRVARRSLMLVDAQARSGDSSRSSARG